MCWILLTTLQMFVKFKNNSICIVRVSMSSLVSVLLTFLGSLICVAFFTLAERKVLASVQRRKGPNINGFWGVLQPIADGLKLLLKEIIIPTKSNSFLFLVAPCLSLVFGFSMWGLIPWSFEDYLSNPDASLLYLYAFSSIGVYGVILAGWSSNSKYAFLGALRSVSQIISYEVSMGLLLLPLIMISGSFNLLDLVQLGQSVWLWSPMLPNAVLLFISLLAETNRAPFDLPEAEAEIVAGYNIEYSSISFAMFFLAEYSNMLWLSTLYSILFFGGWLSPCNIFADGVQWLILKTLVLSFSLIAIRAAYPRYRFDHLLSLGWSNILPIALGWFLLVSGITYFITW